MIRPARPLVLVMVGLPARGKTFLARKLRRYLAWLGYRAAVFNVGNYRRQRLGSQQPHSFFDPDNADGVLARRSVAMSALDDVFAWLEEGGGIAIYDATNATGSRRQRVLARCAERGVECVFVEQICNDPTIVEANVRQTKLSSPDYEGKDASDAVDDFRARIAHYERSYEPLEDPSLSWVKLVDVGRQVVANRIEGYVLSRVVLPFLMNLHITPRPIWLTRHGESAYNPHSRIGGDPPITARGHRFAAALAEWLPQRTESRPKVWTSTLLRTRQTAAPLPWEGLAMRALDEIDAGIYDGLSYDEVEAQNPEDFAARKADKLRFRYPRGESYLDVIARVNPVILELERQRGPVLVVAHNAVIRCLYGYFVDRSAEACPHLEIPLHTVIELTPRAYGCEEHRFQLL